ncbi:serine/threonine-protein kinase DDB_G0283821-like [Sycon ciliatum]|uniref:serine/threonine-protein kinase DDB_G0283821-like n=1 Tax=Sycon ciliatum TaxID=27933 RepID=UPI0031F66E64
MELEALPLMRELGLTNQDIVFLGEVRVRQEDELGRGSDAAVYRLNWQGIDIALKVLHPILIEPGVQDRERKIRSFGQEVFRLSRTHHPNLCQLLGIARVGRNAALALELLTSTLEELSIGEDRDDGLKLIGYLCDTSAGIRYLHLRGIIHRDLAPKNVMIKNGVAKVCDFGVAKFVRLASPRQQQHQVQAARMDMTRCPGTLAFMPPEALVEQPDYDRPLDIFSLGVTLLAVITGVMPGIDLINAPAVVIVQDASGRERTQVVPETRRRAAYLRRLADDHPLKPLAVRCHSNEPSERPTAEEVHEEMKRVLQLFTSLSSPHPSNVPPAVVRRLDSISEQLTQQATSITALATRSDTLEEQLTAITNNQTAAQQQLTATQQQLEAAITNNQTAAQQQLTETQQQLEAAITNNQTAAQQQQTATQQQLTATREQVSKMQDEQSTVAQRLEIIAQNQTTTQQQLTAIQQQVSTVHNEQTTANRRVQALADQLRDTSSASATSSATTATVPVSSPIAAQDSRSSSAAAPATASATVTRAEATAAASTAASSVGRGYHVLPAMPTPRQIANIKRRRKWKKLEVRQEVRQHGKRALVATYSDRLVAVWYDGVEMVITKIVQTSDLKTWRSIDLPSEYSKLATPSLASHGGMLYMYCNTLPKSTTRGVRSILQYCDTPDNGDGGRGGGGRQWAKVTDVPSHCNHSWCTLHVCHDSISLYGGVHHDHVSIYSLASQQWSSSSALHDTGLVLPSLPLPCREASLVPFPDSMYMVGGGTCCFLKHHDGRWVSTSPPDGVELVGSAACALSEHSMVICPHTPAAECVVYDITSRQIHSLPAMPVYIDYTPSLTLFGSTLVLSIGAHGPVSPTALYTLDMSV